MTIGLDLKEQSIWDKLDSQRPTLFDLDLFFGLDEARMRPCSCTYCRQKGDKNSAGRRKPMQQPDVYPDQLPNPGIDYRPDPFLIGDNSAEIQKLNHASNQMDSRISESRAMQVNMISAKVGELMSIRGGRSVNLAALADKLWDEYRIEIVTDDEDEE